MKTYTLAMTTLKARFDGRVLVPEEPVDLPVDAVLEIQIIDAPQNGSVENGSVENGSVENGSVENGSVENGVAATTDAEGGKSLLMELAEISRMFPDNPDTPTDLAAQHDHYLHGMPKRP